MQKIFPNILGEAPVSLTTARSYDVFTEDIYARSPSECHEIIRQSGLQGRGGAGFSTAKKWDLLPKNRDTTYLVVNADEGEPGTCKDGYIMRNEPYVFLEGCCVVSHIIQAKQCFIYIRGEYEEEYISLKKAITTLKKEGLLSVPIVLHKGAGSYVCGEETALLESLEGKKGMPRIKPPFPTHKGLYDAPTIVNNVETISTIPAIIRRGPAWFRSMGTQDSPGSRLFSFAGTVHNPTIIEAPMGMKLKNMIEQYAHGVIGGWSALQAIIPGGASAPLIPANLCETLSMDFESLKTIGSGLGTAGIIVFNDKIKVYEAIRRLVHFYKMESCGQCTPCREGTSWLFSLINQKKLDRTTLDAVIHTMIGTSICALGESAALIVKRYLKYFGEPVPSNV